MMGGTYHGGNPYGYIVEFILWVMDLPQNRFQSDYKQDSKLILLDE